MLTLRVPVVGDEIERAKTMSGASQPTLYQVNTRAWMTGLERELGRPATLDDVPDAELDRFSRLGLDWIWLLSVWSTGQASREISLADPALLAEMRATLPDLRPEDVPGSGFAITGYQVHDRLGGDVALARFRQRLRQRGLRLMLDFVPNHTALDHPWAKEHPEYYIQGTESNGARAPGSYHRLKAPRGDLLLAHGRDPYFPPWTDTLQLNYGNPATREAMIGELLKIASQCDGARCDMSMLVEPGVFQRTWGVTPAPFWPDAIARTRQRNPDFCFLAEVYWGMEQALQQRGFDYTYDKELYDRVRAGQAGRIREHLSAAPGYQRKLARFLENHDEPRAAAIFSPDQHRAAALVTYLAPGMRFFQQGQFEGRRVRLPAQLDRAPAEEVDAALAHFYQELLRLLRRSETRHGDWRLLDCLPAGPGDDSCASILCHFWEERSLSQRLLVAVNYSSYGSRCHVRPPLEQGRSNGWVLRELTDDGAESRKIDADQDGFYLALQPWQYHAFAVRQHGA